MCVGLASRSLVPLDTVVKSHIQQANRLEVVGWHQKLRRLRPVYGFNMCFLVFIADKTISCRSLDSLSVNWAMTPIS